MNRRNYTKGKTLEYAVIISDRLYFVTKKHYLDEKANNNRDTFKGYSDGTIEHQAQCHGYLIYGRLADDVVEVRKYQR